MAKCRNLKRFGDFFVKIAREAPTVIPSSDGRRETSFPVDFSAVSWYNTPGPAKRLGLLYRHDEKRSPYVTKKQMDHRRGCPVRSALGLRFSVRDPAIPEEQAPFYGAGHPARRRRQEGHRHPFGRAVQRLGVQPGRIPPTQRVPRNVYRIPKRLR